MGSISLPVAAYIAAGAAVVGAGASAYESHQAGVAASNADKRKARIEQENATQKQIDMRQNMLRALASQNAAAGVGNASVSNAVAMRQITQAQNDLLVTKAGASAQVSLLDEAADNARRSGNIGAVTDLASGAAKVADIYSRGS